MVLPPLHDVSGILSMILNVTPPHSAAGGCGVIAGTSASAAASACMPHPELLLPLLCLSAQHGSGAERFGTLVL